MDDIAIRFACIDRVTAILGHKQLCVADAIAGAAGIYTFVTKGTESPPAGATDDGARGAPSSLRAGAPRFVEQAAALGNLPIISIEEGMAMREGRPTPNDNS